VISAAINFTETENYLLVLDSTVFGKKAKGQRHPVAGHESQEGGVDIVLVFL